MNHLNKKLFFALAFIGITLASGAAFAGDTGSVAVMKDPTYSMNLTFSPLHLVHPVVEIVGEFKAEERWSVALIGGGGTVSGESGAGEELSASMWEVGGQARYYALGDFNHGLQLGAEALYIDIDEDDIDVKDELFTGVRQGVAIGPFVGYKLATELGLTVNAQLGVARTGIGAGSEDDERDEVSHWKPLVNLNVGWSF